MRMIQDSMEWTGMNILVNVVVWNIGGLLNGEQISGAVQVQVSMLNHDQSM